MIACQFEGEGVGVWATQDKVKDGWRAGCAGPPSTGRLFRKFSSSGDSKGVTLSAVYYSRRKV